MRKKTVNLLKLQALMVLLILCCVLRARAQEDQVLEATEYSQFMTAKEKVEAKETPERTAAVVITYEPGDMIYVTGKTEEGWYVTLYQGKTGYIEADTTGKSLQEMALDIDALNQEMEHAQEEGKLIIEETERYRAEVRRSKIWGTVIALLVIGIIITGIISTGQFGKKQE
ncbi:MAG: SH3 domain-containing protein [Lachnospiraceae bacterium]|nr:SH3 domain-containing protein [Lachnospiraceae bacterium]